MAALALLRGIGLRKFVPIWKGLPFLTLPPTPHVVQTHPPCETSLVIQFFFFRFFFRPTFDLTFDRPKKYFFEGCGDFGVSPRAFLVKILGFGVPVGVKIRGKCEKRDFVKIVLPLWK